MHGQCALVVWFSNGNLSLVSLICKTPGNAPKVLEEIEGFPPFRSKVAGGWRSLRLQGEETSRPQVFTHGTGRQQRQGL